MDKKLVSYEKLGDILYITIDSPPVNSLSQGVVAGLVEAIAEGNRDAGVKAMVLQGAGQNFIAGADIGELGQASGGKPGRPLASDLTAALEQIDNGAKPVVMAIDGFALGGGLEVALSGHWRIGTDRARVGLPELKLGLIPGAGGTQRLPRLVGAGRGAQLMLEGAEVKAKDALALGILQEVCAPEKLREAAIAAAQRLISGEAKPVRPSQVNDKIGSAAEARDAVGAARKALGDKARNQIHQEMCLDAIETGALDGYTKGLERERENFARCLASTQASGMIHMFFASRTCAKVPGVTDQKFPVREIRRAAVLGGGTMGSGIATALLEAGLEVILKEVSPEAVEAGRGRISGNFTSRVARGKLPQAKCDENLGRLSTQTDYAGFDGLDLVIEAVIENVELKQQVFSDLERSTRGDCILASNTSTIDLEVIGERTKAQSRILGTHFFSPAHVMPLVEIVRSKHTSPETLNSVINLVKKMRKTPVTVGNCVGFLVNRIFYPYGQAAGLLVDRGVDPYRIDKALFNFGMPMGPFRMSDLAGVDVAKFAGGILAEAYGERNYQSTLTDHLFAAKRFGQKTGKGYYRYADGNRAEPDPEVATLVEAARKDAGRQPTLELSDQEIVERVLLGVVNEACRCLDEGVAIRASDIDVASVMGMGFPVYRGGIMKWADTLGSKHVADQLNRWTWQHGNVYQPCDYLKRKAEAGESLLA